jgi:hypothetical protein
MRIEGTFENRGDHISGTQKLLPLSKKKRENDKRRERGDHISGPQTLMLLSKIETACGQQSRFAQLRYAIKVNITVFTVKIGLFLFESMTF